MSTCYARGWKKDPDEAMEESELFANCAGFDATRPFLFDRQPRGLTTLDMPVLLLWGTLDLVLLPRQGRRFERLIPGAELRYLRSMGHTPMSDAPGGARRRDHRVRAGAGALRRRAGRRRRDLTPPRSA